MNNYMSTQDVEKIVKEYLRDNLRIHIEQDSRWSNSESKNIDVTVRLGNDVICKNEFDIYI